MKIHMILSKTVEAPRHQYQNHSSLTNSKYAIKHTGNQANKNLWNWMEHIVKWSQVHHAIRDMFKIEHTDRHEHTYRQLQLTGSSMTGV